ncbi:MAG: PIN domain-containing protein [Gammaproteobacteria bacterium]|nr:PIN domain-containing protein [Gammaproteobacteria bacterium]
MGFVVVLDACVLYPAPLRDLLLRLATTGLFAAKWTDEIHDEWMRNLIKNRPEIKEQIKRTKVLMNKAIPDCLVTNYESLVCGLTLPDEDDRHVLAAAIKSNAQIIVTFNLKDFPKEALNNYDIEAMHPDVFIEHQLGLHQGLIISAIKKHRASLKKPHKTAEDYLDTLSAQGLVVTADLLREFIDLI